MQPALFLLLPKAFLILLEEFSQIITISLKCKYYKMTQQMKEGDFILTKNTKGVNNVIQKMEENNKLIMDWEAQTIQDLNFLEEQKRIQWLNLINKAMNYFTLTQIFHKKNSKSSQHKFSCLIKGFQINL